MHEKKRKTKKGRGELHQQDLLHGKRNGVLWVWEVKKYAAFVII